MEMEVETEQDGDHLTNTVDKHQFQLGMVQSVDEGRATATMEGVDERETSRGHQFTWIPNQVNTNSTPSFRDAVAGSSQWFKEAKHIMQTILEWEDEEVEVPDSQLAVCFPKDTLQRLREPWRNTLMAKILGMSITRNFLIDRVNRMWKIKDRMEVIDLGQDIFLLRFQNVNDMERALYGGPWFILNHYLMLTPWKPDFRPSQSSFDKIMAWIRFPELPLEYYEKDALFTIAKKVGKPIKVDFATDTVARGRYARVCIELDLSKALVTKIWVAKAWQGIEYENLNLVCFQCGMIGHRKEQCAAQ